GCDLNGNVRWIRRPVSLPPDEDTSWVRQHFERPLIVGQRVILSQPGVRSLECVDANTGRLAWQQVLPNLETVIGAHEGRVIVRTEDAFIAFSADEGKELWRYARPAALEAVALGGP